MNFRYAGNIEAASTTRISTDLEMLWRNRFFAQQEVTPARGIVEMDEVESTKQIRQLTETVRFAGEVYDPAIIRFYEDVITELQMEVQRYKTLWKLASLALEAESAGDYVPRQTVRPSPAVARKLSSSAKQSIRVPSE